MEIILLEKIRNLGDLGDAVRVKNGYARNYLLPRKKAVRATAAAKAEVEQRRRELALDEHNRQETAQARADLAVREVTIARLAGEEGRLYGSVSPIDLAQAMTEAGSPIEKSEVLMPDGPIKQIGEFTADIVLHSQVRFSVQVTVVNDTAADAVAGAAADSTAGAPPSEQADADKEAAASAEVAQPAEKE